MSFLKPLDTLIYKIEKASVTIGLLALTVIVFANVVTRYIFKWSWVGSEEIPKFIVVWITFIGTSICVRKGIHITMSAFFNRLSYNKKRIACIIICILSAVFCLGMSYLGWKFTQMVLIRREVSPALRIPFWIMYLPLPLGLFFSGINYIRAAIKSLKEGTANLGIEQEEEVAL
ncbi:MAG: TRAP transporter small permease [Firmicutes bacterium]|jgi:C4-dicarboxylate transporter DctQ subunit|nr:TRAP transporter small permease [Bacillota bacterium]